MSWRDSIQICMDVPIEVCNAKGGNCDECSIDRVLEALKKEGVHARYTTRIGFTSSDGMTATYKLSGKMPNTAKGWLIFIPEEA